MRISHVIQHDDDARNAYFASYAAAAAELNAADMRASIRQRDAHFRTHEFYLTVSTHYWPSHFSLDVDDGLAFGRSMEIGLKAAGIWRASTPKSHDNPTSIARL